MAELLANWLNNEIELSKTVSNFEKDFANGYLFGELLYKFNQQSNFKEFSKKDNVASKIENFQKLQTTLSNLKIKFDSKMIDGIMKEERGTALRLLYQLKMSLEKVYPPTDIAVLRKTGKMGDNQPALKIAHSREQYDQQQHTFFKNRLQELNKPQKQINMEKHLEKFESEKKRQERQAAKEHQEEMDVKDRLKQEIRRAQINKLQRNAGFMDEWQQKGVGDWKVNQQIKKEREKKQLEFEFKQAEKYKDLTLRKVDDATKEVNEGIDQFEKTLKTTYGIQTKVSKDDAERAVSESLQNSPMKQTQKLQRLSQSMVGRQSGTMNQGNTTKFGGMTLTSTGLKTKDKKTVNEQTRKERERRRRKMIVDQAKTHNEMEQQRREQQIVERMKKQAKQEEELAYEQWRTDQCKNVIIENRKLREARYEKRRELDQQTSIWREEEMLRQQKEQMDRDMQTFQDRDYEMRIVQKQAKREQRSDFARELFDAIFDIADEAYQHQQQCDSQDIDPRNWKEWQQLFIEQVPIQGTLKQLSHINHDLPEQLQDASQKLDQMELVDYLKNQGQWSASIISQVPVNLEQMLTGQTEAATGVAAAKGAKGAPAKAPAAEQITLEEGDTELPLECPNNFILGDAIEMIININYEARMKHKRPQVPHFLNLKLCLVGYAFAGKKTQAKKLREEYGLEVFYINELVQQAIDFSDAHTEPIQSQIVQQQEERIEDQADGISEDSELQEEQNPEEDFRLCGLQAKDLLLEGEEIADELYVKLIVAKLRMTFPHKNKKQLRSEIRSKVEKELELQKRLDEIEREVSGDTANMDRSIRRKRKTPEQLNDEANAIREELRTLGEVDKNGWVLVDFPSNFAQAKLLETALTGYVPVQESEKISREEQIEEAYLLVQPNAKEIPSILLMKSGVDSVVWFDTDRKECMRRALGRRYDSVNDNVYHIEDCPPLTTNAPLCERLTCMDQEHETEATLIDRWMAFDQGSKGLEYWLKQFGIDSHQLSIFNKIDANANDAETFEKIKEVINQTLRIKLYELDQIKDKIRNQIRQVEEEEQERVRKLQEEEEEQKRREESGVPLEETKQEQPKVTKPEPATERVGAKEANIENVDNDFKPVVMNMWQELSSNYKRQMKGVFNQVRGQRERISEHLFHIQKKFLDFLHRADTKQEKLDAFIKEFNEFSDAYPDLREDDATKEELQQRVDMLSDELWEIIEDRKDQEVEERKKIMESGWVEHELAYLVTCAQQLMQGEVDKFKQSIQILHDFYHAFEDKLIPELPPVQTVELVQEGEELPPVEVLPEGADQFNPDLYTYPRLDTIFSRALKAQVVPDVTQVQATAGDKKGAPAKGGAKDPKKGPEDEKPVEESQYVKEMKASIKVEKAILRFRLTQIRNWALLKLKEMRSKCLKVYTKLEDWIHVAVKTENDAVEEMSVVLKRAIEEQRKIQDELRIKFMDFCVDEKIMNYIEPPPERLPAMEELRPDRFNIEQLKTLIKEFQSIAEQQNNGARITNKSVVDLFIRKLENFRNLGDECGLPEQWKDFAEFNFQTMVRNLDKQGSGYINWKLLATYICLLNSNIATEKEADSFGQELLKVGSKDGHITQQLFAMTPAWFDQYESSQDREYSHPFPRVQYIKELLFNINKSEKDDSKLNIKKLITTLKAKELTMFKRTYKTYGDILLLPSDK